MSEKIKQIAGSNKIIQLWQNGWVVFILDYGMLTKFWNSRAYIRDPDAVPNHTVLIDFVGKNNLGFSNGEIWSKQHKIITKLLKQKGESCVDNIIGKYSRKICGKVDLNDLATRFSFEVISNILLDNSCEEMYDDFVSLTNSATIVKLVIPTPFSTPEIGRIHERIISMKSTFYIELLELFGNNAKLAAKAVSFIMLAGFETASTGIICAVHRLAFDQDLQEKVRTDQTLIPKLISLSLFANPPLMQNFNMLTTSNIEIGDGVVLPKNTRVNTFINAVHNYPDFSMDNNADSFCTFSGGQRRCVGEGLARIEIRAFIKLMLNFRFKTDDRLVPNSESAITAKPERIFIDVF